MSLGHRIAMLFRAKANKALDRAEDPREMLDYSYERQLELLAQVRRGVADVTTSRRRVELQIAQLEQSAAKLQGQAQQALAAGREDLAREALTRRAAVTSQMGDLQGQQASLQAEQDKLTVASQRLQAQVEAFRTRKETNQGRLHRRRRRNPHQRGRHRDLRGDGRCRPGRPACAGQDRADASPSRRAG
jgi:phage shock protein A